MAQKKRPRLGQRISASDRLVRRESYARGYSGVQVVWRPVDDGVLSARPVSGVYAGYRTLYNGSVAYEDGYSIFAQTDHFEAWLIIPSERENIVRVLPEHCTLEEES